MRLLLIFICLSIFLLPLKSQTEITGNKAYGITFSFPWANYFQYVDYQLKRTENKSGFFGLSIAVYQKIKKEKISFNCGFTEDLGSPIGAIDYFKEGVRSNISCGFADLMIHHSIYRGIGVIGGINFSGYSFQFSSHIDSVSSYRKTDYTIGLTAGLEYRFNKNIAVAAIYRPALASFETDRIYRHVISLDLRIDVDVWKKLK